MTVDLDQPGTTVGVVGAGAMGRGIAQVTMAAGFPVLLTDVSAAAAADARAFIERMLRRAGEKAWTTPAAAEEAIDRLTLVSAIGDLYPCAVVIEAIVEDLEEKRTLFARLEDVVGDDCILASNTSSLSITSIASACRRPERVAGAHFFNPVPLMKLVEVVDGERTDPRVGDVLMDLVGRFGHKAVRVRDVPLFLVNHAGRGYGIEALAILEDGVADFADVDRVMREAAGFPMGPFELFDLTALDVSHRAMEASFEQFYGEPRLRPTPETRRRLEAGLLGQKSGAGFYRYEDGRKVEPAEPPAPDARPATVWISRVDADARERVRQCLEPLSNAVGIEEGGRPSDAALCLVTPFGEDATTAVVKQNLDPRRTLAIDTILPLDRRVTLMATPLTERVRRDEGHGLFAALGLPVTLIADSPGFIAQRMLAAVVNVAAAIAQQRIGTPEDIDEAVRIGRGYPKGPLTLGDDLGAHRILAILDAMHGITGEPRYRRSPWLRRRVRLGVSLLTPDLAA